jgi:hypothetical protein
MNGQTMRHYHVIENTPGYLPDADPATFGTFAEARLYATILAGELRDDGYVVADEGGGCYYAERTVNDLGRVIETTACHESECDEEAC